MRSTRAIALFIVLGIVTCSAQSSPEEDPICDRQGSKKVDIADDDATILGFSIGHTSLDEVQAKLGKATIERVSHDEESDVAICYVSSADGTVFAVYSGAMGGWKDITSFALWSREVRFPNVSRCTSSTEVSRALTTKSGIRLGLTAAELKRIVGVPSKVSDFSMKYDYACRRKMTQDEITSFITTNNLDVKKYGYFDRMSWIDVRFKTATVSRVEVGRTESW